MLIMIMMNNMTNVMYFTVSLFFLNMVLWSPGFWVVTSTYIIYAVYMRQYTLSPTYIMEMLLRSCTKGVL